MRGKRRGGRKEGWGGERERGVDRGTGICYK
jgi:hypothetical protein